MKKIHRVVALLLSALMVIGPDDHGVRRNRFCAYHRPRQESVPEHL